MRTVSSLEVSISLRFLTVHDLMIFSMSYCKFAALLQLHFHNSAYFGQLAC